MPAIYDKTNLGRFLHRGGASMRSSGMMMAGMRDARRGVGNGGDRSGLSLPQAGGRLQRQDAKKKRWDDLAGRGVCHAGQLLCVAYVHSSHACIMRVCMCACG